MTADGGDEKRESRTRGTWKQDPEAVRADILQVATREFAANGLSGARIDEIAARTKTSKRMIYYYFGDKNGLYTRVLEEAYSKVRAGEALLNIEHLPAAQALQTLVEFTFDHHCRNPDFIRLVMIENIHFGQHMRKSAQLRQINEKAIDKLKSIYQRGLNEGVFRDGITPMELHWQISALSFFNVSNRHTFALIFGDELLTSTGQLGLRLRVVEMVLRFAMRPEKVGEVLGSGPI